MLILGIPKPTAKQVAQFPSASGYLVNYHYCQAYHAGSLDDIPEDDQMEETTIVSKLWIHAVKGSDEGQGKCFLCDAELIMEARSEIVAKCY